MPSTKSRSTPRKCSWPTPPKHLCEWTGQPAANCHISQYADDISLYYQSSNKKTETGKKETHIIIITSNNNHININHGKSNFVLFTNKKNNEDLQLPILNRRLEQQKNVNFLGVDINNLLSCNDHVEKTGKRWKQKWLLWTNWETSQLAGPTC